MVIKELMKAIVMENHEQIVTKRGFKLTQDVIDDTSYSLIFELNSLALKVDLSRNDDQSYLLTYRSTEGETGATFVTTSEEAIEYIKSL